MPRHMALTQYSNIRMIKIAYSFILVKTLEMKHKLPKMHSLELHMGRHGNHAMSHYNPNGLIFENNISILDLSGPND